MSRVKRFAHSLFSGSLLLGANIVYTLASVPLALHYLSREEFGLWALVMQVSGYLLLIDLGMSNSIARILIDHKDSPSGGAYGAVIKTGVLVLVAQGVIIALSGAGVSFWLPELFAVPAVYRRDFQFLVAGQCVLTGVLFAGRITGHVLQAHQRYDAWNYAQVWGLLVMFVGMWLGFVLGWGVYSLLAAYAASNLFISALALIVVIRLKLLPPAGAWGRASLKVFKELFVYGRDIFLMTIGWQLVNASQVIVISRTLGLEAAAVWSIATKPFAMAQMAVNRLLDFATAGFAEMMVRGERERLLARFRDLVILSASVAAWAGLAVALCNPGFLVVWTKGRISWSTPNDWLMALVVMMYSTTRCFHGLIGISKLIGGLRYVYPLEGTAFVGLSFAVAPRWGMSGIIAAAFITNLVFSGSYGFWRIRDYFGVHDAATPAIWLRGPLGCAGLLLVLFGALAWVGHGWSLYLQLGVYAAMASVVGVVVLWRFGLTPELRAETAALARSAIGRLRMGSPSQTGAPDIKV